MADKDSGNNTPKPELTLDALASSLETNKGTQNPVVKTESKIELPDPDTDPKGFKEAVEGLGGKLHEIGDFISQSKERDALTKVQNDVNAAVDFIASQVEGVEKRLLRAVLKDEVDSNPTFEKLWNSRDANPDAFNKALGILSQQYREQFAPRIDSQVSADQRAFQESVRAARGESAGVIESQNNQWAAKSGSEFDRDWNQLSGRGMI